MLRRELLRHCRESNFRPDLIAGLGRLCGFEQVAVGGGERGCRLCPVARGTGAPAPAVVAAAAVRSRAQLCGATGGNSVHVSGLMSWSPLHSAVMRT